MDSREYKTWPVLDVKVTNYMERVGIEIKTDSLQTDGSRSWIVISRGINKYVTELPEENEKPIHYEEVTPVAGELVATKQQEQFISSSSSFSTTVMPIDQRKWNDIPAVEYIDEASFNISKKINRILRHQGHHREHGGAMESNRLLPFLCQCHPEAPTWTNQTWMVHLHWGKQ